MILEGAVNETASELRKALKLPIDENLARDEIKKWMNALKRYTGNLQHPHAASSASNNSKISVASRVFLDRRYTAKSSYRETLKTIFMADVASIDRDAPGKTAQEINKWVEKETFGLIPSIISPDDINGNFVIALGNAIYFKGVWKYQFEKKNTRIECFYTIKGECIKTEMMNTGGFIELLYASVPELGAAIVDLPYADKAFSMLIVLPNERDGIQQLIHKLQSYSVEAIAANFPKYKEKVSVEIPKFDVRNSKDMVKTLKSLNVSRIFGLQAQLNNMVNEDGKYHIEKVLHSTKLKVNEEGSEGAAVTIGTGGLFISPGLPIITRYYFKADHPFLCFIRDTASNAVLFAGQYYKPEYNLTVNKTTF